MSVSKKVRKVLLVSALIVAAGNVEAAPKLPVLDKFAGTWVAPLKRVTDTCTASLAEGIADFPARGRTIYRVLKRQRGYMMAAGDSSWEKASRTDKNTLGFSFEQRLDQSNYYVCFDKTSAVLRTKSPTKATAAVQTDISCIKFDWSILSCSVLYGGTATRR
jgi:hypothetical protein